MMDENYDINCERQNPALKEQVGGMMESNINTTDEQGIFTTALYLAAEAKNTSAISWLLKWSPTKVKDILEADSSNYGTTALHGAATIENPAIVLKLLEELSDHAKQVNVVDKDGNTPLHTVVKRQNVKVIQALLRTGADPCQKNIKGEAPLHIAVKKGGNLEVLLYRVAEVDTPDLEKGQTPLHLAVIMHLQLIKELE
ncbi:hypothetical protein SELMODRAFT_402887 [Selaginella moellendorffii]|uniref:Uncharacterized protein n=1 Tax=Selaginella moellendorffii TaxID=88036 RepID=D8QNC8_SELML|nr:hypothetical protein SELMODRAFT_402887 [Selaginella moellendorffii]